jgi:hypothetical protein
MFGAEPQERWTQQDIAKFERYAAMQLRRRVRSAARAALILLVSVLFLLPFTAGHPLNKYWNTARFLVYVTLACFLWFFMTCMFVWSEWQSARETRRDFADLP